MSAKADGVALGKSVEGEGLDRLHDAVLNLDVDLLALHRRAPAWP